MYFDLRIGVSTLLQAVKKLASVSLTRSELRRSSLSHSDKTGELHIELRRPPLSGRVTANVDIGYYAAMKMLMRDDW